MKMLSEHCSLVHDCNFTSNSSNCFSCSLQLEDIKGEIEKLRIGHDGKGFGAGWHLDKVEVRRLKDTGKVI
jgi:PLAT/LH2 domain